jgi:hypothetical protein
LRDLCRSKDEVDFVVVDFAVCSREGAIVVYWEHTEYHSNISHSLVIIVVIIIVVVLA